MREVERRAAEYGLPAARWPDPWPGNTLLAMRTATYATSIGKGVQFALAAFRQAFAGGRDLSDPDSVMIAAAACELHPNAVAKAVEQQAVKDALKAATEEALARGVVGVPDHRRPGSGFLGRRSPFRSRPGAKVSAVERTAQKKGSRARQADGDARREHELPPAEEALELLDKMLLIRHFEERAQEMYMKAKIGGFPTSRSERRRRSSARPRAPAA